MAVTFPLDLLLNFPGYSKTFDLHYRQERSRTAAGNTIVKDFGSPIWHATYETKPLRPNVLDKWRAIIESLDGGINLFKGMSMARKWPIAYPHGIWTPLEFAGGGFISGIGGDNKTINISSFPAGFKLMAGDMIRIDSANLHRVMQDSVASAGGTFTGVELRPNLWPGAIVGQAVNVVRPYCLMAIDPDSLTSEADKATGMGAIAFEAWEVR